MRPSRLDIDVSGPVDPRVAAEDGLSRQILEAVVDEFEVEQRWRPPGEDAPMSLDDEERQRLRELFVQFAETRDRAIRDELIEAHLRLAEHLARRFANRGVALDDLIQVASLGLVKAVERFEPDRGLEFSTFATPTIVGELKRHFRDKGWAVRVPRRVQELHVEVNTLVGELTQRYGRSPTISELARMANTSEEEVLEAMEAAQAYRSASIDAPVGRQRRGPRPRRRSSATRT